MRGEVHGLGLLALLVAAASFAGSQVYSRLQIDDFPGPVLAAAGMTGALVLLLPFAVVTAPPRLPHGDTVGALLALALVSTALAQLLFYRMVKLYGIGSTTVGGYLVPVAGLVFGTVFLSEDLTVRMVLGLLLTLLAVAIGSGLLPSRQGRFVSGISMLIGVPSDRKKSAPWRRNSSKSQ